MNNRRNRLRPATVVLTLLAAFALSEALPRLLPVDPSLAWAQYGTSRRVARRTSRRVTRRRSVGTSAYVSTLPAGCAKVMVGGAVHYRCAGTLYRPEFHGDQVVYVISEEE